MIDNYPDGLAGTETDPRSPFYYGPEPDEEFTEVDSFGDDE